MGLKIPFGGDEITERASLQFLILLVGLIILSWLSINATIREVSEVFWIFGLTAAVGFIGAFVIKGGAKIDFFDAMIAERPIIPIFQNPYIKWGLIVGMFLFTFFVLAGSDYRIATPSFQLIETGLTGDIFLTIAAALMEDMFFFVVIPMMIYGVIRVFLIKAFNSDNTIIPIILMLLLSPAMFVFYHAAVYGLTNQAAIVFIYVYGFEIILMVVLLKDVFYAHARHLGNNLGNLIFTQMSFVTFFTLLLSNIIVWIAIIAAITIFILIKRRK